MTRRFFRLVLLIGIVMLVVFSSAVVTAAVTTNSDTSYNGAQADSDQAIEITYTISPDGSTVNNMTINFESTSQTFIESNSFSFTVTPGSADINVESRQGDRFFIEEIESNEEVTFVFNVYPKTIKQEQIDAASVGMDYAQLGQDLSEAETVTANMSSSPWFELLRAEETISEQESELRNVSLVGQITDIGFLGGIVVGLLGIGFGTYSWQRRNSEQAKLKREHAKNLESLGERMENASDEKDLYDEAEEIRDDLNGEGGREDW